MITRRDAMSIAGNKILRTPNIDRIGLEGIRFTEFFVTNSLCAPSRATFYTGLYSHSHGVLTNGSGEVNRNQGGLRSDQITFMHLLQQAGYETALVANGICVPTRPGSINGSFFPAAAVPISIHP